MKIDFASDIACPWCAVGLSAAQLVTHRANIRAHDGAVGFTFGDRNCAWNTFDAHRLLHWAGLQDVTKQRALKHALLRAYHGDGRDPSSTEVLLAACIGSRCAESRKVGSATC